MAAPTAIDIVNKGRYAPLSNYAISQYANYPFISIAHLHYYNMVEGDISRQNDILKSNTIGKIYESLGYEYYSRCTNLTLFHKNYNENKVYAWLYLAISLKITKDINTMNLLLSTGKKILNVMNGTDNILGVGKGRRGLNLTGKILMTLRDHYLDKQLEKAKLLPRSAFQIIDRFAFLPIEEASIKECPLFDIGIDYSYSVTPDNLIQEKIEDEVDENVSFRYF